MQIKNVEKSYKETKIIKLKILTVYAFIDNNERSLIYRDNEKLCLTRVCVKRLQLK